MELLPKIRSFISSFMLGEDGKISKQSVLSMGALFVGSTIGILASESNASTNCELTFTPPNTEIGKCIEISVIPLACAGCGGFGGGGAGVCGCCCGCGPTSLGGGWGSTGGGGDVSI